jgi:hypothetical protein
VICKLASIIILSDSVCYTVDMKYASIFFTILFIWLAIIIMALSRNDTREIYQLYLIVMVCTVVMFLIGFAKK